MFIIAAAKIHHCFHLFCYYKLITKRKQERAHFYSSTEQELIIEDCQEEKAVLTVKSQTAAAAKSKQRAWQRITHKLNELEDFSLKSVADSIVFQFEESESF